MGPLALQGGSCTTCTITLSHEVTLASPDDTTDLHFHAIATRLGDSSWLVAPSLDGAHLARFDAAGRATGLLGRSGAGPGEFAEISYVLADSADMLTVFDPFQRRATRMSLDGDVKWTHALAYNLEDPPTVLPGGGFLLSLRLLTTESFGIPIHITDSVGTILRSFGGETVPDGAPPGMLISRILESVGDSTIWAAHRVNPQVERWSMTGELLGTLQFPFDWFPLRSSPVHDGFDVRSSPLITDIHLTNRGLLLVLVAVDVASSASGQERGEEGPGLTASSAAASHRSRLVVLDPAREIPLGYTTLPGFFTHFASGSSVARLSADSNGAAVIDVFRLSVVD